jgi:hypothetical protein
MKAKMALIAVFMVGIASAASHDITIAQPAKAGETQLKAGTYGVKLADGQAVFTRESSGSEVAPMDEMGSGKSVAVPVKVEHAGKKFAQTSVQSDNKDGKATIQEIDLGGTDTRLVFGQ